MKTLNAALWAEYKKVYKSKILWATIFLFVFIPLMMGLMIYIVRHPEISEKLGLLAAKASLFSKADWPAFFGILNQSIASIGLIGFGFVTSWVFGRENMERTIKDILALPVSRSEIVFAKFVIIIAWCLLLTMVLFVIGLSVGKLLNLEGWCLCMLKPAFFKFFTTSLMTILLCSPVAYFATYSRGLVLPLGFVIITLITAQFVAIMGLGAFFPWAIPGVYTVSETAEGMQLYTSSYVVLILTFLIGYAATVYRWRHADQH